MADTSTVIKEESVYDKDWTKGPILRNILLLSWPMAMMETLYVVSQVLDLVWVGRLGPTAIAGLGVAFVVVMIVMSMDLGLVVGARAIVARYVGAGDITMANHVAAQAVLLTSAWGLLMTILGITLAEPIMRLLGVEADVITEGVTYMRILFAGWVTMDLMIAILYIVQSSGDVIRPLILEVITRGIHVVLCPLLVLGWWIFPEMGISGAAISSVIGQIVGTGLAFCLLFGGGTRLHLRKKHFRLDLKTIVRILKIGFPALVMHLQRALSMFVITWLIVPFGTLAIAANSVVQRVEMFLMLPGFGLGMGAGVLVGQNLGARQPERAEKSAWLASGILEAFMIVCSVLILVWAKGIIGIFTTDPEVVDLGGTFLRIATMAFFFIAFSSVLQNCIAGAGDTIPNMVFGFIVSWVVQLPLALLLSKYTDLGVLGIRWGMAAGVVVGSIIYVSYFRLGRWKLKKV